jgi:hypothetical protein
LPLLGSIDQALDTTDVLSHAGRSRRYRSLLADVDGVVLDGRTGR